MSQHEQNQVGLSPDIPQPTPLVAVPDEWKMSQDGQNLVDLSPDIPQPTPLVAVPDEWKMSQDGQNLVDLSPDFPQPPPSVADPDEWEMSQDGQNPVDLSPDFPQPPPSVTDPDELQDLWAAVCQTKKISADTVKPAIEKMRSKVYNPELRNGVLIPLGIVVEDQPGPEVGTLARAHFDTEPIGDYSTEFPGYHVWLNSDKVKAFMIQYRALIALNATEHMRVTSIRRNLLPPCFEPITGRAPIRNIWFIERLVGVRMPTSSYLSRWPPILRDGYDLLVGSNTRGFLAPNVSYWLSFAYMGYRHRRQLQTVLCTGSNFCSYLTGEWYTHMKTQSEVDRAALASAVILYNRFRLRETVLSMDRSGGGESIPEMDLNRNIKHFCITFGATHDFTVWLVEPSYSAKATPLKTPVESSLDLVISHYPITARQSTVSPEGPAAGPDHSDKANADGFGIHGTGSTALSTSQVAHTAVANGAAHSTHWNGCKVRKMVAGSLRRECDVEVLADWINEIHRWALEVHLPAVITDAEALTGLDTRRGQEHQPMWLAKRF